MSFAPSNFARDWYGHLTNQGAHGGLVGIGGALAALALLDPIPAWLAVVMIYAAYEVVAHWYFDDEGTITWDWPDSIDDTSNVAGGAAVVICALAWGYWQAVIAFAVWAGALALSTWKRM